MNQLMQMILQQRLQQIPQGMMTQMEQQLKRTNPQMYQRYQKARQNNEDPNTLLDEIVGGFDTQKKQQWDGLMQQFNQGIK